MNVLMKVINKEWGYDNDKWILKNVGIGFEPSAHFYKQFKYKKSKCVFTCNICKTKYDKGVTCIGTNYWNKICFVCISKMKSSVIKDLDNLKKHFIDMEKEYKTNKDEWENKVILSKLKGNTNE